MHIKTNKIPVTLTCVLAVIYILEYSAFVTSNAQVRQVLGFLDMTVILLIGSNILIRSYNRKTFCIMSAVGVIFIIMYVTTGFSSLISMFLIIVSLKNEDVTKLYRSLFITFLITFLFVLFLYIIGISNAGEFRENATSLGFSQTNRAAMVIHLIYFLYLMQKKDVRLQKRDYVIAVIMSLITFITTKAYSSTFILLVCPFFIKLLDILNNKRKRKPAIMKILKYVPLIYLIMYILLIVNYSNPRVQILNSLMSNRIFMSKTILEESGISLFGHAQNVPTSQIFDPIRNKYIKFFTLDGYYIFLIINYGVIGTLIWMTTISVCIKKALRNNNMPIVSALLLMCTWFITETESSIFSIIPITYLLLNDNTTGRLENEKVES